MMIMFIFYMKQEGRTDVCVSVCVSVQLLRGRTSVYLSVWVVECICAYPALARPNVSASVCVRGCVFLFGRVCLPSLCAQPISSSWAADFKLLRGHFHCVKCIQREGRIYMCVCRASVERHKQPFCVPDQISTSFAAERLFVCLSVCACVCVCVRVRGCG